jgi:hypothetical protein
MAFAHTTGIGVDTYHVLFKNGKGDMDIWLSNDGKLKSVRYFPS